MKKKKILLVILLLSAGQLTADAQIADKYDVVIDEVMADPAPPVGLPNNEWVELRNTTGHSINLLGWRFGDAGAISGPLPAYILKPDSLVILCSSGSAAALSPFGTVMPVTSFPSLDNNGEQLSLRDATGKTIHAIAYDISWYRNDLKKNGGWSLEMIDTKNPCAGGSNWEASTADAGGTPGRINSVDGPNEDQTGPRLMKAHPLDSLNIVLVFDEPVDSLGGANAANYAIDGGMTIDSATTLPPLFETVQLKLVSPMLINSIYTVTANNLTDCKGNAIGSLNTARVGLPAEPTAGDMIVNEILFDPRPNAYDYIELYNKSNKVFDASRLFIANRNTNNSINSITQLSSNPWLIFPGDYIVLTEDAASLSREYLVKNPASVLSPSSLPSFPDDKGFVLVLNFQGDVVDEVDYFDDWHFKLIVDRQGVALERIDPEGDSHDPHNWHSAGSTAGYGTPTYKNSQFKRPPGIDVTIEVSPKVFSPDNDGLDDVAMVQYKTDQPGYVANITVFDASGRPVRSLVRNELLASAGYWNWDGLDDKGNKLAVGTYVIFTELFNLQGKKERFKNAVVLARKLN